MRLATDYLQTAPLDPAVLSRLLVTETAGNFIAAFAAETGEAED